jgi:hypothetical protein
MELVQVGARPRGEEEGLADGDRARRDEELVRELCRGAGAGGAEVLHAAAHGREDRERRRERLRAAAHHDRERALGGAGRPAADGRVEEGCPRGTGRLGHAPRRREVDRGMVGEHVPLARAGEHAVHAEKDVEDVLDRGEAGEDDVRCARDLRGGARHARAERRERLRLCGAPVVHREREAGLQEVRRHGPPHVPEADEADPQHGADPPSP